MFDRTKLDMFTPCDLGRNLCRMYGCSCSCSCMFVYTCKYRIRSEDDVGGQARVTIDAASAAMRLDRNEVMHI